ncbi:MAG: membrane protein insertion efficiency factor YidD [Nitrospiria bacterium]
MTFIFIKIVRLYQLAISPFLPSVCRFSPSCSSYSIQALKRHGSIVGVFMTFKRLIRCHPFCSGGYDPVK